MKYNQIPIDEDTFHQICENDDYEEFLSNNPSFCRDKKEGKTFNQSIEQKEISIEEKIKPSTNVEDFRVFMMLTWLELYLPRYELKYGLFEYSNLELNNRDKIKELLEYYVGCGITDIEQIRKNSFKGFRH